MCGGNLAAGKQQIVDVARIETPVRNSERGRGGVQNGGLPREEKRFGHMFIHIPAAEGHRVGKDSPGFNIVLGENMVAFETPALPFAGETADPVKRPAFSPAIGMVLDVCPCAVSDSIEFIPDFIGIFDKNNSESMIEYDTVAIKRIDITSDFTLSNYDANIISSSELVFVNNPFSKYLKKVIIPIKKSLKRT